MIGLLLVAAALAVDPTPVPEAVEGELALEAAVAGPLRTAPPEVLPADVFDHPALEVHDLGGVIVRHLQVPGVRKVAVRVTLHRGAVDLDQGYTAQVRALGQTWDLAVDGWDAAALEAETDRLDASISPWIGYTRSGVDMSVPRDELASGLELLGLILKAPTFPNKEFKAEMRSNRISLLTDVVSSMRALGSYAGTNGWYPADHPYGTRVGPDDYKAVKRADVAALHQQLVQTAPVSVLVVGDLSYDEVEGLGQVLAGVGARGEPTPDVLFTREGGVRVLAIGLPGAGQAMIGLRADGPTLADGDHVDFSAANFALGGSFLARLNRNLREENGYTYGIYSSYDAQPSRGYWMARTVVSGDVLAEAVGEMRGELAKMVESGVTSGEIDAGYRAEVASWNGVRETADSAADFYEGLLVRRQSVSERRGDVLASAEVTPASTAESAARFFSGDAPRLWVLVGDPDVLRAELVELGWSDAAEWLTPEQAAWGVY
jgi:zinc protease